MARTMTQKQTETVAGSGHCSACGKSLEGVLFPREGQAFCPGCGAGLRAAEKPRRQGRTSRAATHPPISACLGNGIWQTASWNDPTVTYQQDLAERTCTCPAGEKGLWCKHLTAAFISSLSLQVSRARAADGVVVRRLLKQDKYRGRADIEMALLLVAWEEARADWNKRQAAAPGDETPPEGGAVGITAAEYAAGVALLSEGRKVA